MNLSLLAEQIAQQDAVEWLGLAFGILYVVLATYEKPACWIFGILSSACIAWKSITDYKLIADAMLQLFYMGIGVYGLILWYHGNESQGKKPITFSPWQSHLRAIIICLVISAPLSWLLVHYADARYGYIDTLLTSLSVWTTFLLIRKDLYNWVYWIGIDIVYVILYWKSDGVLFALLFFMYTVISIWGLRQWKQSLKEGNYVRNIEPL